MVFNTSVLKKGIDARFHSQYTAMLERPHLALMERMFTRVSSNGAYEDYAWLGDVPGVREWVGDKTLGSIKDYDYTIKNKDWYDGFAIDRNELEDQQVGAINPRVDMLAMGVAQWPSELIIQLIENGDTNLAYDGQAFFANRSVNDNLLSGSGTTVANVQTDINSARTAMMKFKSDSGRVMGLIGDTLLVPPEMEATFLEAVNAATFSSSATSTGVGYNPIATYGMRVIPMPELTDSDDFYMFATNAPLRPFIFQERSGVRTVLDDTEVDRNRKLYYSAEVRGNAGYAFPQMAIKVVNS